MAKAYNEDSIEVIEVDVERIKERLNMYIGYTNAKAVIHLIKEIIQNSLDESMVEDSTCDEITVLYDETTKIASIIDNGRGIPHGSIVKAFTYIQSSGKFKKGKDSSYKYAAGENGVGGTATNALSNFMEVTSFRNGKSFKVRFENGYPVSEEWGKCPKSKTGTIVTFQCNEDIIGKYDGAIGGPVTDLCEILAYLVRGVKIVSEITPKKGKKVIRHEFKPKNGIVDLLAKAAGKDMIMEPVYFYVEDEDKTVEVALTYSPHVEENIISFANYCTTVDHGTHVQGFKTGLSNVVGKFVREEVLSKTEKDKLNISTDDVKMGLVAIVNARHVEAHFIGQVKEKIDNEDLNPFVRKATTAALQKWLKDKPNDAKRLGKYIKDIAKARLETQKLRKSIVKTEMNIFNSEFPKNYKPAKLDKAKGVDLELIIIEGESAGGSAREGRDDNQALFYLKGVLPNTYDAKIAAALQNDEIRGLVNVLGCGIGKNFDIKKCKFKRIIIMTDADIDGYFITSLASTFFTVHMPELVINGMVYKVVPPLYKIKERKGDLYLKDNREYYNYVDGLIGNQLEIADLKGKKLPHDKVAELLYNNRQYLRTLTKLGNRFAVNPTLLENMVYYYDKPRELTKYMKTLPYLKSEKFKDGSLIITGVYDREFQYLKLHDKLMKKVDSLLHYIYKVNDGMVHFKVNGELMTLGQLMAIVKKFEPENKERYKGLGQMSPDQLWETTLDPEERNLIQLVSEDIEHDTKRFAVLHSGKKAAAEERKKLMAAFKISFEDIDT